MDIEEKMKMCFNDELMENKILTEDEKKVLASLMYSYQICKEAKDNTIIRAMPTLRKDIKISNNALYDAVRNLESLYHMIERTPGKCRKEGETSEASIFKLNFDAIFNPPKERVRFDFFKKGKSSETSINTADIDTDIEIETDIDIDINKDIDNNIIKDSNIDSNTNNDIEIKREKDVVFENEIIDKRNNSKYINNIDDNSINLDYYFINSSLQTHEDIQVKSQLYEMIDSFKKDENEKQLLSTHNKIFDYMTEHQDKLISWKVEDLKEKVQKALSTRYREIEEKRKTHQPA